MKPGYGRLVPALILGVTAVAMLWLGMPEDDAPADTTDNTPVSDSVAPPISGSIEQPPVTGDGEPESKTVRLEVAATDPSAEPLLGLDLEVPGDATVLDALQAAASDLGIAVVVQPSEYGAYVEAIGERSASLEDNDFWFWSINGVSATVAVDQYIPAEGEVIRFWYE